MDQRKPDRLSLKDALRAAGIVVILLLFPYPVGLLLSLGIPLGWIYLVVYAGWAAFAVFIAWLSFRRPSRRASKWPHRDLMYVAMGALFLWYGITNTILRVSNAVNWFVFIAIAVWFFVEGTYVSRERRASRA